MKEIDVMKRIHVLSVDEYLQSREVVRRGISNVAWVKNIDEIIKGAGGNGIEKILVAGPYKAKSESSPILADGTDIDTRMTQPLNRFEFTRFVAYAPLCKTDKYINKVHDHQIEKIRGVFTLGIQIDNGWRTMFAGTNVSICSNQCVHAQLMMSNRMGIPEDKLLVFARLLTSEAERIAKAEQKIISTLVSTELAAMDVARITQQLTMAGACQAETDDKDVKKLGKKYGATLNWSQCRKWLTKVASLLDSQNTNPSPAAKAITAWDLYNAGTAVLKPGLMDESELAEDSAKFAQYMIEQCNAPVDYSDFKKVLTQIERN